MLEVWSLNTFYLINVYTSKQKFGQWVNNGWTNINNVFLKIRCVLGGFCMRWTRIWHPFFDLSLLYQNLSPIYHENVNFSKIIAKFQIVSCGALGVFACAIKVAIFLVKVDKSISLKSKKGCHWKPPWTHRKQPK